MSKYVCLHAHFYQPPRENPWLDRIQAQESAAPFHDWNERISSECYRENGRSRIVNGRNFVEGILNNYSKMSFNFGPTLLSWMEDNDPRTYDYIINGDLMSQERLNGHGNAIAQCYNHMIMPLANRLDKETQTIWGIKDFEKRFNRYPEAMWLPETAVDIETLEVLAQYRMKYVILAPRQAKRVRKIGQEEWIDVSFENINTRIPYLIKLPSGERIAAFFYNGGISKAVAFDGLLHNGDYLANRILSGFSNSDEMAELVHIATDGESYGHHHKYGDMALAYALKKIEEQNDVHLCNYASFLEMHPPVYEVEIFENSSWSCAHGIERWRSDCGCNSGGGPRWNQQWRKPLRATLDELRDAINVKFVSEMERLGVNPWEVRNDFIEVIFNRSLEANQAFIAKWIPDATEEKDQVIFIKSLELQRQLLFMYTSCAWFFDESSGIETVQVLQYALRAVELAEDIWGSFVLDPFLKNLKTIPSNIPHYQNAYGIYEKIIKACQFDFYKLSVHYAVTSLFKEKDPNVLASMYRYDVKKGDLDRVKIGSNRFVCGHAEFRSRLTYSKKSVMFAAVHLGENILSAGVTLLKNEDDYKEFKEILRQKIIDADLTAYMREFDKRFDKRIFTVKDLIADDRNYLIKDILARKMDRIDSHYQRIYNDNLILVSYLRDLNIEMPTELKISFEYVINKMIIQIFKEKIDSLNTAELERCLKEAENGRLELKASEMAKFFQERLIEFAEVIEGGHYNQLILSNFLFAVKFAKTIVPSLSLSETQFLIYKWHTGFEAMPGEFVDITREIFDVLRIEYHTVIK